MRSFVSAEEVREKRAWLMRSILMGVVLLDVTKAQVPNLADHTALTKRTCGGDTSVT